MKAAEEHNDLNGAKRIREHSTLNAEQLKQVSGGFWKGEIPVSAPGLPAEVHGIFVCPYCGGYMYTSTLIHDGAFEEPYYELMCLNETCESPIFYISQGYEYVWTDYGLKAPLLRIWS